MNVEIGAEAALFPEKEYIKGIFVEVQLAWLSLRATWRLMLMASFTSSSLTSSKPDRWRIPALFTKMSRPANNIINIITIKSC
jgi:hypothetical protein